MFNIGKNILQKNYLKIFYVNLFENKYNSFFDQRKNENLIFF